MTAEQVKTEHILAQRQSTFILFLHTQSQGNTHSLTIIFSYSEYYIMSVMALYSWILFLLVFSVCFFAIPNCSRISKIV